MIYYKNLSFSAKTFYGIRFEPGDTKAVPGYINCNGMVRIFEPPKAEPEPTPLQIFDEPEPVKVETRGRKKKSIEPDKGLIAETETTIETSKEET